MKKFIELLLVFISLGLFISCDNDEVIYKTPVPIELKIEVTDAQGNDLMNPLVEGNIRSHAIKAVYKGEVYSFNQTEVTLFPLEEIGLYTKITGIPNVAYGKKYLLTFGPFDIHEDFMNEEVIIEWGDGSSDVINFSNTYRASRDEEREFAMKFNGEPMNWMTCQKTIAPMSEGEISYAPLRLRIYSEKQTDGLIATFKGKEYAYSTLSNAKEFCLKYDYRRFPYMSFRDITVDEVLVDEPLLLKWGDGQIDEFIVNNYKDASGRLIRNLTLNGKFLGTTDCIDLDNL